MNNVLDTCVLAYLDGLGVDAEDKLSCVNGLCYSLTDVLAKQTSLLPTLIELPASYKIRNGVRTLSAQTDKEIVLAVNAECFRCDGKATTSRSEKVGTTPRRGTFPLSFT